ncbi:ABC transporter ATP-binding protein [Candidatus Villigracilis saccharophilus]|uniref:ABC transporter ATP-binding protein n=1 Tax=Candidatus Villigracilis saccharophilus TaxID=3140684 RepID=UPI0031E9EB7C
MNISFKSYWNLLSDHIRPQKGRFVLLAILMFGSIGLRIYAPQIMRKFIDSALAGEALQTLTWTAVAFIGIALIQQAVAVSVTYLGENVAWTATNDLRAELAEHALHLDMKFHNDHTPGELIERIDGDVTELATFFSQFALNLIANGLLLIGILIALFIEDWRAGLAFTVYSFLTITILGRLKDIAVPHQKARREAEAQLYGFHRRATGWHGRYPLQRRSGLFHPRIVPPPKHDPWSQPQVAFQTLDHRKRNGLCAHSGNSARHHQRILAFLRRLGHYRHCIFICTLHQSARRTFWAMTHEIESFQTIGACVERLTEFRNFKAEVVNGMAWRSLQTAFLSFEDVSFSYNGADSVLSDLSFDLKPGSILGLLGRTGSGKTTLGRLIFRLYDVNAGRIKVNDSDLREAHLETLRRNIAIVTQDVQLFRASIRDNLTFFDRSIPDEKIIATLEELELGDWLRSQPKGLDTELDTGSRSLSAGEAQLLAFTRVFLRNPGLVILDEASSRLDPATEQKLERAIDKLLQNRTAIIIAHRLDTIHRADEIMILDNGKASEYGERKQLAADPTSRFYQLLQTGMEEVLA